MWWGWDFQPQPEAGLYYSGMTVEQCRKMIQKSLQTPKVKFLREELEKSGCHIGSDFIRAVHCKQRCSGVFSPGRGILICSNYLRFQDEVTQTVIHELIHAYDDCRAANLDWRNCAHRACAEIRASHLSGDCHYIREFLRGFAKLRGHEPDCVRRRATKSVRAGGCSEAMTKLAMEGVWNTCYNDTKPFDRLSHILSNGVIFLTSSLSSVLNQHHCINIPKQITLRFFSLKPCHYSPAVAGRFLYRRTPGRSSASAFSVSLSRSFSKSQSPVSSGIKLPEIPNLHHFIPKATAAAISDASVSDPQLDSTTVPDLLPRGRIYHETYGCQMNVNDMEIVLSIMKNSGYSEIVEVPESAEIIFINTCAIRDNAEQKVWQRLNYFWFLKRQWKSNVASGRSQSLHPPKVVVLGCMAERLKDKILDADKMVDVVCGPDAYRDLPRLLEEVDSGQKGINTLLSLEETYADINPVRIAKNSISAFVSVMRGCNNMCSFCIVPFTRGRERSRPVESIVREVAELSKEGVKEVTLLGQNVNSYNDTSVVEEVESGVNWKYSDGFSSKCKVKNVGLRFADLLDRLAVEFPEMRFRYTSPHPKDFPDELLYVMRDRYNICKSIHLPAQSGSSTVLEWMRRGYTRESYLDLVEKIRAIIPGMGISSDFICGFCGETEEDHQDTLTLIRTVGYDMAYMFAYSMREKTHAHRNYVDDVPDGVKQRRLTELIEAFRDSTGQCYDSKIGTVQLVLVEGPNKRAPETELIGKSDRGHRVSFTNLPVPDRDNSGVGRSPKVGDYVEVEILKSSRASLHGEAIAITKLSSFYGYVIDESIACVNVA